MAFRKCPRCDLNYILDDASLCTVCRREVKGESEPSEILELCSECGEHPAIPGSEYCLICLKAMNNRLSDTHDDTIEAGDPAIGIDSVSTMDEIELDIDDDIDGEPFSDEPFDEEGEEAPQQKDDGADVSFEEVYEKETSEEDEPEEE